MITLYVLLDTVDKVKNFVQISSRYPFDIDLSSGRYVVDGKSIMGIFSFDLRQPIEVRIISEEADDFIQDISHLIAEDS